MTKLVKLYYKYKKNQKYHKKYLEIAKSWSQLSQANKKKVGCIIVKNSMIISDGYNGTPSGCNNLCEDSNNTTLWYVIHAEANAILKLAKSNNNCENSTLYTLFLIHINVFYVLKYISNYLHL